MTLQQISETYKTDKSTWEHNYYDRVYDPVFSPLKDSTKKVCEIGVCGQWKEVGWDDGHSLAVWRDFFTNAEILGLDHLPFDDKFLGDRVTVDYIDQSNKEQVIEYSSKLTDYDIIIDDGSHKMYDQQITLAYFFKSLKSGGIFVMEDLHTSPEVNIPEKNNFWKWGEPGKVTTLELLEHFNKTGEIISDYLTDDEKKYLKDNILSIDIYDEKPNSITSIIIKK